MVFLIGLTSALIVVFLLAYITIRKPAFGETIVVLAVLMVIAATFFYFQKDNRIENKKHLIPLEQIDFSAVKHTLAYGNYYKISAQLKNNSTKYLLRSLEVKISFYNCPANNTSDFKNCRMLSEKTHSIVIRLAAQQSATIESYFLLDDEQVLKLMQQPEKNHIRWKIEPLSTLGR